jgi:hypothetical protein
MAGVNRKAPPVPAKDHGVADDHGRFSPCGMGERLTRPSFALMVSSAIAIKRRTAGPRVAAHCLCLPATGAAKKTGDGRCRAVTGAWSRLPAASPFFVAVEVWLLASRDLPDFPAARRQAGCRISCVAVHC